MSDANDTGRTGAREKHAARARLLKQATEIAALGAMAGRAALTAGLRASVPLMEVYSGVRAKQFEPPKDEDGNSVGGNAALGLNHGQVQVLRAAGGKLLAETIEIASVTHPAYEGAPAYSSALADGVRQPVHLAHLVAVYRLAQDLLWSEREERKRDPETEIVPQCTVVYMAVAPGEYIAATGPQSPAQIRRAAMRERSYNPPPMAILASNNQPVAQPISMAQAQMVARPMATVVPYGGGAGAMTAAGANRGAGIASADAPCGCGGGRGCGCGCRCSGTSGHCSCGRCRQRQFGPPRYKEDGACAPIGTISCETRWRMRDCVKFAFCDALRCMAEEMCEDGKLKEEVDLGDCVEVFLCSLISCLPEAICPEPSKDPCCHAAPEPGCGCNFAVQE